MTGALTQRPVEKDAEFEVLARDLRGKWALPPERFEDALRRADNPMPAGLEGIDLGTAMIAMAETALLDIRPEVRLLGVEVLRWLRDGRGITLDKWLGLSDAGRGQFRETIQVTQRNVALRYVARLPAYDGLSPTAASKLLRARWQTWSHARHERDEEGQTFARLARAGHEPLHDETIRKILAREGCLRAQHTSTAHAASGNRRGSGPAGPCSR